MSLGSKRIMSTSLLSNMSKMDLFYHLLVHLHQETTVCSIVRILTTSDFDLCIRKVVKHKGGTKTPACAKCRKTHPDKCHDCYTGCFMCDQEGNFVREFLKNRQNIGNPDNRAQSSTTALLQRVSPTGAISGIRGGENRL